MSAVHSTPVVPLGCSAASQASPHEQGTARSAGLFGRGRSTRVLMLAGVIAVMSAADLYITALYLGTIGMAEENPLARLIMSQGSIGYLSAWKLLTVLPTLMLMVAYRRRLAMELLGWVACAVLVGVMVRWVQYASETDVLLIALQSMPDCGDPRWVTLGETPSS